MKRCPKCNRDYADETINFCLIDGAVLSRTSDSEATQHFSSEATQHLSSEATQRLSSESVQRLSLPPTILAPPPPKAPFPDAPAPPPTQVRQGVSPLLVYALITLLALIVGGGLVALLMSRSRDVAQTSKTPTPTSTPVSSPTLKAEVVPTPTPATESNGEVVRNVNNSSSASASPRAVPQLNTVPGKYPEASNRYLNEGDLAYKPCSESKIMRNEIFARHGYIFKTPDMINYFSTKSWYKPLYSDVSGSLTEIEKRNIQLVKVYESRNNCG